LNPATTASKQINTRNIIQFVIVHGEVTRPQIASSLNLSIATVTNIVTELIGRNILAEGRKDNSPVGRKATFLRFNHKYSNIIAVIITSPDIVQMSLCDLSGEVILQSSVKCALKVNDTTDEVTIFEDICSMIVGFIHNLNHEIRKNILAVEISLPGIVRNNTTAYVPFLNWKSMPLGNYLQKALEYPVFIENVTRIKAIYEMRYIDPDKKNVLYLALSPGIGLVNFFNGKMIMGKLGINGEVGHMTMNVHGPKCYCGNHGCFEIYCGENYLLQKAAKLIHGSHPCEILCDLVKTKKRPLSIETLFEARNLGSIKVQRLLTEAAEYLGAALVNLYNLYDPDEIIISGTMIENDDYVLNLAIAEAKKCVVSRFAVDIAPSKARLKTSEHEKAVCADVFYKMTDTIIG